MNLADPFATAVENDPQPPVVEENKTTVNVGGDSSGISVTFKFDGEFSAPWVVIHADDVTHALEVTKDPDFKALMDRTAVIAGQYKAGIKPAASGAQNGSQGRAQGRANTGGAPRQRPAGPPPGADPYYCDHGEMKYFSGTNKNGAWAAWGCPLAKDDPEKCSPIDAKTGKSWN